MNRRLARDLAMKAVYQSDIAAIDDAAALAYMGAEAEAEPDTIEWAAAIVKGVRAHHDEIEALIAKHSHAWRVERLALVDRSILRVAVWELQHQPETPTAVIVNEAVELAKTYGGGESGRFVNGVLGPLARMRGAAAPQTLG